MCASPTARRPAHPTASGISLLEVLLAVVLFASGTVAIIGAIQQAHAGLADGENLLLATHLAQRRLEELRNASYGSVANEAKASVSSPSGFVRFSREVIVTTPYTNLKQVVVTVSWTTPAGETHVSLQAYRSNG